MANRGPCGHCAGTGWSMPCALHEDDPPCRFCNGTGKVWASVEGERVFTGSLGEDGFMLEPEDLPRGGYRIIVQPLKEEK